MSNQSSNTYQISDRERANLSKVADYTSINSLPEIWSLAAKRFGDITALHDPHAKPEVVLTYTELNQKIRQFASGLQSLGVQPESLVALFADNSPRWMIADQGIMMAGAANAVRSAQGDREELLYILRDSGSTSLVVEDLKTLKKLRPQLEDLPIELVVLLSDEEPSKDTPFKLLNFEQLMATGANASLQPVAQFRETLATLLYTSGTTGKPKGVMLSYGNLLHQITTMGGVIQPTPGERALSILPTWHVYERTVEYFLLSQGCSQIYTNIRSFKKDLQQFKPHYMVAVPRLWEAIYEGVQKQFSEQSPSKQRLVKFFLNTSERYINARRVSQGLSLDNLQPSASDRVQAKIRAAALKPIHTLAEQIVYKKVREATGGQLRAIISGGGSLSRHLDNFYEIVGITILVGYGLTETSPITNVRRPWHNLRGSAGWPMPETAVKIVDLETRQPLPSGERGLVMIHGPQVMQGYYKNPEATEKAIDSEGWFNTGDLGWITPTNDLVLTGRAKDTIVLTNGENIEPQPIEDACLRSAYIDQIMLVGQDQRSLGALIVPNLDALKHWAAQENLNLQLPDQQSSASTTQLANTINNSQAVRDLFRQELNREVKNRPGYRSDDRIGPFQLILEPFSSENGLMTQTLKIKRPVVSDRYHDIIDAMFEK